jgi:hypothetical protein
MNKKILILFCLVAVFTSCKQEVVTLDTLLNEMVEREALAKYPEPSYELAQFSSYDRATVQPGDESWFANGDRTMFIRTDTVADRIEHVMFDAEGPGAIVRFWMTFAGAGENSGKGIMRIYFDHEEQPSIEGTAFDILSGGQLVGEPLSSSVSDSTDYAMRGHNLYLPLPYAKHCKVTYESDNVHGPGGRTGEAVYYNINYRTYEQETKVVTYSPEELTKSGETLELVQSHLKNKERGLDEIETESIVLEGNISPGNVLSKTIDGSKSIRMIGMKVNPDIDPQKLRTTVLEIVFDGNRTVWSPIGDFFGTGYLLRYSDTWYTEVKPESGEMKAFWVMPFKNNTEIKIHNLGDDNVANLEVEILTSDWDWDNRSMHFGTSWHQYSNLFTREKKDSEEEGDGGHFDINFVSLEGEGVYVGDAITLFNTAYAWWGEGDEKIYVDGESFPSHIGTGTEDYYGYAWCRPEKFSNHPYIAQPDGSGNFWPGYTINIRHRGLDAIPFNSSLKVDMEMWHWHKATINYAPVTFWYVKPNGKSNILPDREGINEKVALNRTDIISPYIQNNKIEGENLEFKEVSGGDFSYQNLNDFGWSKNMQLFWTDTKPGDKLKLAFYTNDKRTFQVYANLTKAKDYGMFRVLINGKDTGKTLDLYHNSVITNLISLGRYELNQGENIIEIISVDKNPQAEKTNFGLDYLEFR